MKSNQFRCIILKVVAFLMTGAAGSFAQYYPPPDSAGGWRTLTAPDEIRDKTGMDVKKLNEAFQYIQGSSQNGGMSGGAAWVADL